MMHILEIKASDSDFIQQERKDPITAELLREGDKVVLCKECGSAFLVDSWYYLEQKHCNQYDTYESLPKKKELALKLEDGSLLFPLSQDYNTEVTDYKDKLISRLLKYAGFIAFSLWFKLLFIGIVGGIGIIIALISYINSTDEYKQKIIKIIPKPLKRLTELLSIYPIHYRIYSQKLLLLNGNEPLDEIRWSNIERTTIIIPKQYSDITLEVYLKDNSIKKIRTFTDDYLDFKRLMYSLADFSHTHRIDVKVTNNTEAEDYINYLRNFRKAKFTAL